MARLLLPFDDFAKLGNLRRSGDWVDIDGNVYHVMRYDFVTHRLFGYSPTIEGYALWLYDSFGDWWTPIRAKIIIALIDCGIGNYPPEGDYIAWSDLWRKEPERLVPAKPITWGDVRKAIGHKSWGGN